MSLEKKFAPLVNHFSGSMKIRQVINDPIPEPTICHAHRDLFRDIKTQNMYIEKLYSIMNTRQIDEKFDVFKNNGVSTHWVKLFIEESERSLNLFPEKVKKHIEKIKVFAAEHNIDITENLKNIDRILEDYNNDPKIQDIKIHLQSKKDAVAAWEFAIEESVKLIEIIAKEKYPDLRNRHIPFVKYDTNIDNNPDLAVMKKFIDEKAVIFEGNRTSKEPYLFDYSIIEGYANKLNKENIEVFIKLRDSGIKLKLADDFMLEHQSMPVSKNIEGFLKDKLIEKTNKEQGIKTILEFSNSKIKEIILFSDNSMLVKKSDNTYEDIFTSKQLHEIKNGIVAENIRQTFNKNPTVAKNFIEIFRKNPSLTNLDALSVAINTYSTNLDFFNSKPFDIKEEYTKSAKLKNEYRSIEDLDDKLNKKIKEHKIQLFAHSIASNKYMHLYNDESYKIIQNIYDLKLKTNIFQDYIGKKIAAYKTPEDFNKGLTRFVDSFNDFRMDAVLNKAENAGVKVISQNDDILIVQIEDYEQSKLLGSGSWCIVRHESYFNSYTDGGNKQYFLFDFSKDSSDNESMIGFTIDLDGEHYAAHYKNDDEVEESSEMLEYAHESIKEVNYKDVVNRTARMSIS